MVNNLSKDYWLRMEERYPEAVAHFYKWLQQYKTEVNWYGLFGVDIEFHHLPFDIQNGIISRFEVELVHPKHIGSIEHSKMAAKYKSCIASLFLEIQQYINCSKLYLN